MIKHLEGLKINTIYDFDNALTINELLCIFWEKIEETINISNESIDLLNWIKEEGVSTEVEKIITELVEDGTIEQMINVDKIEELRTLITNKITVVNEQLDKKINDKYNSNKSKIEELQANVNEQLDTIDKKIDDKYNSNKSEIEELNEQLDIIANKGTTVEVLERVTKEEINRQLEDGTIANLTIEDNSITWDKFKNELKSNINQLVKNTIFNNDGSVKEIFTDNKYKITTFENNVVNEKWYTSDNNLLFTKTTTLNDDGSFSESLI